MSRPSMCGWEHVWVSFLLVSSGLNMGLCSDDRVHSRQLLHSEEAEGEERDKIIDVTNSRSREPIQEQSQQRMLFPHPTHCPFSWEPRRNITKWPCALMATGIRPLWRRSSCVRRTKNRLFSKGVSSQARGERPSKNGWHPCPLDCSMQH